MHGQIGDMSRLDVLSHHAVYSSRLLATGRLDGDLMQLGLETADLVRQITIVVLLVCVLLL